MIPISTDLTLKRTPYANYILIAVNIIVFILSYAPHPVQYGLKTVQEPLRQWTEIFILNSARPQLWQFITYGFLHSGYQHIIGNMFFLYLFGNNVNDRLGNTGYVSFYFSGCIFAGIGYSMLHNTPVLGASGAVSAVTGAYLVLFPRSVVTVLYWFVIIGTIEVPAIWFILLKMVIIDNIINARYMTAPIAYNAHLAGYAFGILTIFILLWTKLLRRNDFDLFGLVSRWHRRKEFERYLDNSGKSRQEIEFGKVASDKSIDTERQQKIYNIDHIRSEITLLLAEKKHNEAIELYSKLMDLDSSQTLTLAQQLDISNYLMSCGEYKQAVCAYENFIKAYQDYEYIEQIHLMLGIIYSRYIIDRDLAKKYLQLADEKLNDAKQKKMCIDALKKLGDYEQ